jgi:hypothetical protein
MVFPFSVIREGGRRIRRVNLAICIDIEVKGLRPLKALKSSSLAKRLEKISAM